ncbi:MAG: DUF927 domain-containing protein [Oscillospiraceae bacterium]|nr:DUF927 domain-containing protein [Oscillospiraceae bacterium]
MIKKSSNANGERSRLRRNHGIGRMNTEPEHLETDGSTAMQSKLEVLNTDSTDSMSATEKNAAPVTGLNCRVLDFQTHSPENAPNDKADETIVPEEQNLPEILDIPEETECSVDKVTILPVKIPVYGVLELTEESLDFAKKIGRKSLRKGKSDLKKCIIVKYSNGFGILKYKGDTPILDWTMQRIDILKKVKAKNGRTFLDILVMDDLSTKQIRVPSSIFLEKNLSKLMQYNVALNENYSFSMSVYFQKLIETIPMEDASQKLGIITGDSPADLKFNAYAIPDGFEWNTEYSDFSEYLEDFNELIKPSPALQYLVATSMSSVILTTLKAKYNIDLHSYCMNIIGASSTGKTISSRFCAALWTNPLSDKIFSAMLATSNAALKHLDGRYGVPTFLDEASILGGVSPTEYGYSVYEEREKKRLNSDCSEKESGTWSTIVIMSSEQHFHCNSKIQNGGMAVRIHSIENLEFTTDKDHADALEEFIRNNYGVIGHEFTNALFDKKKYSNLDELYEEAKESMREYVADSMNGFTERLLQTYAVTYLTATLLKKLGLAIQPSAVAKIMAEHNKMVGSEQNLALNAQRAIISYVMRNPMKSGIRKVTNATGDRIFKIIIEESLTKEILEHAGFTDLKVTLKEMAKSEMLIRQQKGRLKSKLSIDGNIGYCYQFDMTDFIKDAEICQVSSNTSDDMDEYVID